MTELAKFVARASSRHCFNTDGKGCKQCGLFGSANCAAVISRYYVEREEERSKKIMEMTNWIKCSDRMPPDDIDVWVYLTDGTVTRDSFNSNEVGMPVSEHGSGEVWFNSNGWYSNGFCAWPYPTHWMEIEPPELPKDDV